MKNFKEKFESRKETAKTKVKNAGRWIKKHKKELIVLLPTIANVTIEVMKIVSKRQNLEMERRLKENYVYNREFGIGHYYETRHKLTNPEWRQIEARKKRGESLGNILEDMDVLK